MAIHPMLDVSMGHLQGDDVQILESLAAMASGDYECSRVTSSQYGFVIHIAGEPADLKREIRDARDRGLSKNFCTILKKAGKAKAFLVNFDEAGDVLSDLTSPDGDG